MYIYKTTNLLNGKIYIGKRVYRKKDDNWYLGSAITNNCVGKSKSSGGFIWSKIKKENIYE